jgi:hypothetical protein
MRRTKTTTAGVPSLETASQPAAMIPKRFCSFDRRTEEGGPEDEDLLPQCSAEIK